MALIGGLVIIFVAALAGWRGKLPLNFNTLMLFLIIGVGLYLPLAAIVVSLGERALTDDEKLRWGRRLYRLGPIALFAFWWRYIRRRSSAHLPT